MFIALPHVHFNAPSPAQAPFFSPCGSFKTMEEWNRKYLVLLGMEEHKIHFSSLWYSPTLSHRGPEQSPQTSVYSDRVTDFLFPRSQTEQRESKEKVSIAGEGSIKMNMLLCLTLAKHRFTWICRCWMLLWKRTSPGEPHLWIRTAVSSRNRSAANTNFKGNV